MDTYVYLERTKDLDNFTCVGVCICDLGMGHTAGRCPQNTELSCAIENIDRRGVFLVVTGDGDGAQFQVCFQ